MPDALHTRVQKTIVKNNQSTTKEFYIRDAQGNTLAVYEFFDDKLVWKEQHLYGAERIGTYMVEATLYLATTTTMAQVFELEKFEDNEKTKDNKWVALAHYVGVKRYEITNHLGNVLAVVTDRRLPGKHSIPGQVPTYWQAEVVQLQEYYVFGAKVPNRCWAAGDKYRYGFNGKEADDELSEGVYAFEARMYSATLGRFFSRDPREAEYAWQSTYAYYRNCPTAVVDFMGMGGEPLQKKSVDPEPQSLKQVLVAAKPKTIRGKYMMYKNRAKNFYQENKDKIQAGLDLLGSSEIPILSQAADIGSAVISVIDGDLAGAGMSIAGTVVPGMSQAKAVRNGLKHLDEVGEGAQKIYKKLDDWGCLCFPRRNFVRLANGSEKPIEDVGLGDIILAYDEETGQTIPRKVIGLYTRLADGLVYVHIGSDTISVILVAFWFDTFSASAEFSNC